MQREQMYRVYCHDPRNGYCMFDFWDLKNARAGCEELLSVFPSAGYKIMNKVTGRCYRRVNYPD